MIRFGLCCVFKEEPILFRRVTAAALMRLPPSRRKVKLAEIALANADALLSALTFCGRHGIGCFRVNSQILPLKTHPQLGYDVAKLPEGDAIMARFQACGAFARKHGMRLSFHPDQFVLLNSPRREVVESSLAELAYQAEVAEWIGADVINIHAGGGYGAKLESLERLRRQLELLPESIRSRLTLENDDKIFTPGDLLPICRETGIPLVYDVHHHRCRPDFLDVEEATKQALQTWSREPLFHISSPAAGWKGPQPFRHHEFIQPEDFPAEWRSLDLTVEVEAKGKELAVFRLMRDLEVSPKALM
jgi:UV DNA damage endonuclease